MELVEFLLARISEDEATAEAVSTRPPWTVGEDHNTWIVWSKGHGALCMNIWKEDAEHVVRWNPVRVLAECAAKRQIIEQCMEWLSWDIANWEAVDREAEYVLNRDIAPMLLRILAQPYADNPDFDPSWLVQQ